MSNKRDSQNGMRGKLKGLNSKPKWVRKWETQIGRLGSLIRKGHKNLHHKTLPEKDPKAYPIHDIRLKHPNSSTTEGTCTDTNSNSDKPRVSRAVPSIGEALGSHPLNNKTQSWELREKSANPARGVLIRHNTKSEPPECPLMTATGPATKPDPTHQTPSKKSSSLTKNPKLGDKPAKDDKSPKLIMEARLEMIRKQSKLSEESMAFFDIYENQLRLDIKGILKAEDDKGTFTLTVRRGHSPDHWIIDILTEICLTGDITSRLESTKQCLPPETRDKIQFDLRSGKVKRIADHHDDVTDEDEEDWQGEALNTYGYEEICMGDSVGPRWHGSSATLGPMLLIDGKPYWLLSWHLFEDQYAGWDEPLPPPVEAVHPSPDDSRKRSSSGEETCRVIGKAVAYSGPMYKTYRKSTISGDFTETDWVLIEAEDQARVNKVRNIWGIDHGPYEFDTSITRAADPELPRTSGDPVMVYSAGRSSGTSFGQIGPTLSDFKHKDGRETREWYIECIGTTDDDEWREYMMGVPGDSGASVIEQKTHTLLGHIWGRNRYNGDPSAPRITYFTKISTLFDDIQDRFPRKIGRPVLPQEIPVPEHRQEETPCLRQDPDIASNVQGKEMNAFISNIPVSRRSNARNIASIARRGGDWGHFYPHANTWPIAPAAKAVVVQC